MGFWNKIKSVLGIARNVSPDLDTKIKEAEELHRKVESVKEIASQVEDVMAKVRAMPEKFVGWWRPGQRPPFDADYILFRGETRVLDFEGQDVRHSGLAGKRLPPGFQKGDRWRQFVN